jgi:shikimate dehydrogenase
VLRATSCLVGRFAVFSADGTVAGVTVPPARAQRRCAVLGSPISHSLSPVLHSTAYEELGLRSWRYEAHDVDEAGLAAFLDDLDESWAGLSLTMPLKRAVIPLCDEVSQLSRDVEAVNTVIFRPDGTRFGENTDVPGMVAALREAGVTSVPAAAVLGGGATATSAVAALREVCTGDVEVYVRSERRVAEMEASAVRLGTPVGTRPWEDAVKALSQPLVLSTTSAGGSDHLADHVPDRPGVLFDVLYHPWPTPLAAAWATRGGTVINGLDQLVHQAVPQVELMTGRRVNRERLIRLMRAASQRALAARTR